MPSEIEKLWEKGKNMLKDCGAEIIDISLTSYKLRSYQLII